jgi:lysophospholipase L1-like esterase
MWEHGMPGSAWESWADLARWADMQAGRDPEGEDDEGEQPADPRHVENHRQRWRRWERHVGVACVAVLGVLSLCGAALVSAGHAKAASGFTITGPFVALGDSYAAGDLIPRSPAGTPLGCLRSTHTYSADVAATLRVKAADFIDVSCSGALTSNMTESQSTLLGTNPPQFSALASDDSLVTLTIGGDDMGFTHILETCILLSVTNPFGDPCEQHFGGKLAAAIAAAAPKVAAVLQGIHSRAPNARVLLVGYLDVLPNTGDGCWPVVPIAYGDVPYLRNTELQLNHMLAAEAAANGATFVDTYTATIGHDVCQSPSVKDVEGLIPTSLAEPFHPNERGEQAMADQVLAALRG